MSGVGFQSSAPAQHGQAMLARIRVDGGVAARFAKAGERTSIQDLTESGGYRLLLPQSTGAHAEAVQINTGGGIVSGDRLRFSIAVEAGASAVYATQAAERFYRSSGLGASVNVRMSVDAGAFLAMMPQDSILYSGSRVERHFEADIAADGRLLLIETLVFGRIASGESMGDGYLHDRWRVRRGGRLVFAEDVRLEGSINGLLARPAIAGGHRVTSLILYVAPDAETQLDAVRAHLSNAKTDCGVSAWNGMLVARFTGADPARLKADTRRVLATLSPMTLPRVWTL